MFYDKLNNRLIYLRSTATEEFWDQHWQNQKIDPPDLPPYLQALRGQFFGRDFVLRTTKQYLALGQSVVDGGCGLGQYVRRLSQAGYEAYGVDFAPHTIAQVTQHYPELDVRVGDVRALPFSDCFFDGYWSLGVIEHFWNGYSEIASEIHRVLKPGGYLFVTFPTMSKLRHIKRILRRYPIWSPTEEPPGFYQFALDPIQVEDAFRNLGFSLIERSGIDGSKGIRDEVLASTYFAKALRSSSICSRGLNWALDMATRRWAGHLTLLVLRKT